MKKIIALSILGTVLLSCARYQKIGNLTMVSTRNVDSKVEYKLIKKDVDGKSKRLVIGRDFDVLQQAIDNAVKKHPEGEFMKNVVIYVKNNGKGIKVTGDIWGIPSVEKNVSVGVSEKIEFKLGDKIMFRNMFKIMKEGSIVGVNTTHAVVEYKNILGMVKKSEIQFEKLTKLR